MSIQIHPCRMCPIRVGCDQREAFRKRARASGAVSVTYRCDRLAGELRPGRRIEIATPHLDHYDRDDGSPIYRRRGARATVTSVTAGHQFTCVVDPEDGPAAEDDIRDTALVRFRRRRPHSTILRLLDEPDMPLCGYKYVQRNGVCDNPGVCTCASDKAAAEAFA